MHNALSRQGKEIQVAKLESLLKESSVVVGLRYKGMTVKQLQDFRKSLPEDSTLLVVKNTLVKRAADSVEGWSDLKDAAKGDNAWLFAKEESIASSIKAWLDFQKVLLKEVPKEEQNSVTQLKVSGAVMDSKALSEIEVMSLKNMPTKLELITKVAVLVKKVPTKVALAIKAVPRKVAFGVQALADASDDKTAIVGDVCKPSEA